MLKMSFGTFSLMTVLGSFTWCLVLSWYGKGVADRNPGLMKDPDQLVHVVKHESLWIVGGVVLLCLLYFLMLRLTANRANRSP
jgi:membrane protein DedA with SNARE-associated domain